MTLSPIWTQISSSKVSLMVKVGYSPRIKGSIEGWDPSGGRPLPSYFSDLSRKDH